MEQSRDIKLTFRQAQNLYKKGGELRKLALQAFCKEELQDFPRITSLEAALKILYDDPLLCSSLLALYKNIYNEDHFAASYFAMQYILKAINGKNFNPFRQNFYVPSLRLTPYKEFYKEEQIAAIIHLKNISPIPQYLMYTSALKCNALKLSIGNSMDSTIEFNFACRSEDIAEYISRTFYKELLAIIFKIDV